MKPDPSSGSQWIDVRDVSLLAPLQGAMGCRDIIWGSRRFAPRPQANVCHPFGMELARGKEPRFLIATSLAKYLGLMRRLQSRLEIAVPFLD
jgi:hypothetical protein